MVDNSDFLFVSGNANSFSSASQLVEKRWHIYGSVLGNVSATQILPDSGNTILSSIFFWWLRIYSSLVKVCLCYIFLIDRKYLNHNVDIVFKI